MLSTLCTTMSTQFEYHGSPNIDILPNVRPKWDKKLFFDGSCMVELI